MVKLILLILVFFFFQFPAGSQPVPVEWGKVMRADLEMDFYKYEPDAPAVVLCDYAEVGFDIFNQQYMIVKNIHQRLKILKPAGMEKANVEIFINTSRDEQILNLEAQSLHPLRDDSAVLVTKLDPKDFYREKIDENRDKIVFSVPGTKVGSVIEFRYKLVSGDYFNYIDWKFHQDIPVIWSELRAQLQGVYNYSVLFPNVDSLYINNKENTFEIIPPGVFRNRSYTKPVRVPAVRGRYVMTNIPSFNSEPFMTTMSDYTGAIKFQLYSINFPFSPVKKVLDTWNGLAAGYLTDEKVSSYTIPKKKSKKLSANLVEDIKNDSIKALQVFDHVRNNYKWNEIFRLMPRKSAIDVMKDSGGNSAEINLLLMNLLRASGLRARPVLISTREHGKIQKKYPLLNQFNHLLVQVYVNKQWHLLDGLSPTLAFGQVHHASLNHQGLAIDMGSHAWIDIDCRRVSEKNILTTFKFDSSGYLSGYMIAEYSGYYATSKRFEIARSDSVAFPLDFARSFIPDAELQKFEINGLETPEEPLKIILEFSSDAYFEKIKAKNDVLYIDCMFINHMQSNPFIPEKRNYPVDFAYPFSQNFRFIYEIPEGYLIDEYPFSVNYTIEDSSARYSMLTGATDEVVQVSSSLTILKSVYQPSVYHDLRVLFNLVVSKQDEMITALNEENL
ncbi:MAG: transglutaminase domain-containing protein [Bacteroidota bacterium]